MSKLASLSALAFAAACSLGFALVACHDAAPVAATTPARSPVGAADPHATAVDRVVGAWQGQVLGTPLGDFPFAIAFEREPAGDIHGRADNGGGMYLDFRFHKVGPMWTLVEEGALPDVGVQTHTLVPAAAGADGPRWVDQDDATYVEIALAIENDLMVLTTKLHGESHAVFRMQRVAAVSAR